MAEEPRFDIGIVDPDNPEHDVFHKFACMAGPWPPLHSEIVEALEKGDMGVVDQLAKTALLDPTLHAYYRWLYKMIVLGLCPDHEVRLHVTDALESLSVLQAGIPPSEKELIEHLGSYKEEILDMLRTEIMDLYSAFFHYVTLYIRVNAAWAGVEKYRKCLLRRSGYEGPPNGLWYH